MQVCPLTNELSGAGPALLAAIRRAELLRVQILISEAVERPGAPARLQQHGFRVDAEYFYPASSIKLCAAVAALQEAERLEREHGLVGLAEAPIDFGPLFPGDKRQTEAPDHLANGRITIAHEVRKLALVSDNQAFNRLYDFVGHEQLNRAMHSLGLPSVVINHRLSDPRSVPDQRASAAIAVGLAGGRSLDIPARHSQLALTNPAPGRLIGEAHLRGDQLVREPMDFAGRNGISLVDLHNLLAKLVRPDIAIPGRPLELSPEHRRLLLDAMTIYPRESSDPHYPAAEYPDDNCKFLLPGVRRVFPETAPGRRIEITGKIGRAYGFSVENSCLRNPANGRTVFVTAVIYTNDDGVLNDDRYEYGTVADPFLADLGEWVARRWLTR
jgi:hypothetical protein